MMQFWLWLGLCLEWCVYRCDISFGFIYRSQMSIIPQDPFLFDDTVAINLDPKQEFSSFEMLNVLEKCHLKNVVSDLGKD